MIRAFDGSVDLGGPGGRRQLTNPENREAAFKRAVVVNLREARRL
ncbi:MAG TPA: hypothetical protein VNV86_15850 [Candidatus Acidoferrum sp.]|jgi:hypothetical protein|nr:hypothetical protein [Candidatus Acidoferrum sp.]